MHSVLVGKPEGKRALGRHVHGCYGGSSVSVVEWGVGGHGLN